MKQTDKRIKKKDMWFRILNNLDYEEEKNPYELSKILKINWLSIKNNLELMLSCELISKKNKGYVKFPSYKTLLLSNNLYQENIKMLEIQKEELRKALIDSELKQFKGVWKK